MSVMHRGEGARNRSPFVIGLAAAALAFAIPALAQKPQPNGSPPATAGQTGSPGGNSGAAAAPGAHSAPTAPSAVMQVRKDLADDLSYRFISNADTTQPFTPLTSPPSAATAIPIAIPAGFGGPDARLEVADSTHGNLARIKVSTAGVTPIAESSFTLAQRTNIPVQAHGLGVIGAQVTLASADKKYTKSWTLQPVDNGIARFDSVPLNTPLTATVTSGTSPPVSQTRTLQPSRTGDDWPPIAVDWAGAKTVAAPPIPAVAPSSSAGSSQSRSDSDSRTSEQHTETGGGIINTLIGLAFLAAIGYGIYWAYQNGKLKGVLDKLGLNQPVPATSGGPQPSPFDKPSRAPIQPITEGTADPMFGGNSVGLAPAPPVAHGPRLVATVGAYSGTIFPIMGASADIGRDAASTISLANDTNTSRRHAIIQIGAGEYSVVDCGSSNGTYVNGVRVPAQSPQPLRSGDELNIGNTRFRFEA